MVDEIKKDNVVPADDSPQQNAADEAQAEKALELMVIEGDEDQPPVEGTQEEPPDGEAAKVEVDDEPEKAPGEAKTDDDPDDPDGTSKDADEEVEKAVKPEGYQRRIDKLTAQKHELREKLETAETRLKTLEARALDSIPLLPEYLSADELAQVREANRLIERKTLLMSAIGVGLDDEKNPDKSLTAKQVAEELVKIESFQDEIHDAQRLYKERMKLQLEDNKVGRAMRLSKQAINKTKQPAPGVKPAQPGAATARSAASGLPPRRGTINLERFNKSGADDKAADTELAELVL